MDRGHASARVPVTVRLTQRRCLPGDDDSRSPAAGRRHAVRTEAGDAKWSSCWRRQLDLDLSAETTANVQCRRRKNFRHCTHLRSTATSDGATSSGSSQTSPSSRNSCCQPTRQRQMHTLLIYTTKSFCHGCCHTAATPLVDYGV